MTDVQLERIFHCVANTCHIRKSPYPNQPCNFIEHLSLLRCNFSRFFLKGMQPKTDYLAVFKTCFFIKIYSLEGPWELFHS